MLLRAPLVENKKILMNITTAKLVLKLLNRTDTSNPGRSQQFNLLKCLHGNICWFNAGLLFSDGKHWTVMVNIPIEEKYGTISWIWLLPNFSSWLGSFLQFTLSWLHEGCKTWAGRKTYYPNLSLPHADAALATAMQVSIIMLKPYQLDRKPTIQ